MLLESLKRNLKDLQNKITPHNFPDLPLAKFKEVFDFNNLQENKVLKSLFI